MQNQIPIRRRKESEDGYLLLAVICMLALLTIALSVAVPEITKSIQRDREIETMHRGKQYIRAIQLYYHKFHAYPPSVDALVKTNDIRFLRKKYIDPMTRKDDWKPIHFGENKAPLAMGFFGQPLGGVSGSPLAGIGPGGTPGAAPGVPSGMGSTLGSPGGGMGSSLGGSTLFGSATIGASSTGAPPASPTGTTDNSGNPNSATGSTDNAGSTGSSGTSGSTGSSGTSGSSGSTTGTGFMSGQSGQTFGGGGIIGFEPDSPRQSILVYKKKDHYNQWEFTYSPLMDMLQQAGANGMAQPSTGLGGQSTTPGFGNTPGFGPNAPPVPGTPGSGSGSDTSPTAPNQPSQPTQPEQ